jgi:hypothetical protein
MNEMHVRLSDDELKAAAEDADALPDPYRGHAKEPQDERGVSHAQHR